MVITYVTLPAGSNKQKTTPTACGGGFTTLKCHFFPQILPDLRVNASSWTEEAVHGDAPHLRQRMQGENS